MTKLVPTKRFRPNVRASVTFQRAVVQVKHLDVLVNVVCNTLPTLIKGSLSAEDSDFGRRNDRAAIRVARSTFARVPSRRDGHVLTVLRVEDCLCQVMMNIVQEESPFGPTFGSSRTAICPRPVFTVNDSTNNGDLQGLICVSNFARDRPNIHLTLAAFHVSPVNFPTEFDVTKDSASSWRWRRGVVFRNVLIWWIFAYMPSPAISILSPAQVSTMRPSKVIAMEMALPPSHFRSLRVGPHAR